MNVRGNNFHSGQYSLHRAAHRWTLWVTLSPCEPPWADCIRGLNLPSPRILLLCHDTGPVSLGSPLAFPDRLLIGFNCFTVVAKWATSSSPSLTDGFIWDHINRIYMTKDLVWKTEHPEAQAVHSFVHQRILNIHSSADEVVFPKDRQCFTILSDILCVFWSDMEMIYSPCGCHLALEQHKIASLCFIKEEMYVHYNWEIMLVCVLVPLCEEFWLKLNVSHKLHVIGVDTRTLPSLKYVWKNILFSMFEKYVYFFNHVSAICFGSVEPMFGQCFNQHIGKVSKPKQMWRYHTNVTSRVATMNMYNNNMTVCWQ